MKTKDLGRPDGVKDIDSGARRVRAYVSSWGIDDVGDQFVPGAWKKSIKERGPGGTNRVAVLYMHNPAEPVARPKAVTEDDVGLLFDFQVAHTTRGNDVMVMYEEGVITEHSVGYDIVDARAKENAYGGLDMKEAVLWEGSPVTWGANSRTPTLQVHALAQQMETAQKALHNGAWQTEEVPQMLEELISEWRLLLASVQSDNGVVPYQDLSIAGDSIAWDAAAARRRVSEWAGGPEKEEMDWAKYQKAFLWFDVDEPENFGAYKLPVADITGGGLKVVSQGIDAAAAVLEGGRGGANIPADDVARIRAHLDKYYAKMDRKAPWNGAPEQDTPLEVEHLSSAPLLDALAATRDNLRAAKTAYGG